MPGKNVLVLDVEPLVQSVIKAILERRLLRPYLRRIIGIPKLVRLPTILGDCLLDALIERVTPEHQPMLTTSNGRSTAAAVFTFYVAGWIAEDFRDEQRTA